jgi:hypothetical protein
MDDGQVVSGEVGEMVAILSKLSIALRLQSNLAN